MEHNLRICEMRSWLRQKLKPVNTAGYYISI